jgi:hypothetical protein
MAIPPGDSGPETAFLATHRKLLDLPLDLLGGCDLAGLDGLGRCIEKQPPLRPTLPSGEWAGIGSRSRTALAIPQLTILEA